MTNVVYSKEKAIEYLSIIRDSEIPKITPESDAETFETCVELLLDLQDKNVDLTPEKIAESVQKIPFIDTGKTADLKPKQKKVNIVKLLLVAALIPIILTLISLAVTADIDWSYEKKLKEMFGGVDKAPVGEKFFDNNMEFGKIDGHVFSTPEELYHSTNIKILHPGEGFTQNQLTGISYLKYASGDEIHVMFKDGGLSYSVNLKDVLPQELENTDNAKAIINDLECYTIHLEDVGVYQVYFNHDGFTYCISHNDFDEIKNLIENLK